MKQNNYTLPTNQELAQKLASKYIGNIYDLKRKPKLSETERKELKRLTELASILVKVRN